MRTELEKIKGVRGTFRARFDRFGSKSAYRGPPLVTACFQDVSDLAGNVLTDHLWMTVYKQLADLDLQPGDLVELDGRVTAYWKGYQGRRGDSESVREKDYQLSFPTKMRVLDRPSAMRIDGEQTALAL